MHYAYVRMITLIATVLIYLSFIQLRNSNIQDNFKENLFDEWYRFKKIRMIVKWRGGNLTEMRFVSNFASLNRTVKFFLKRLLVCYVIQLPSWPRRSILLPSETCHRSHSDAVLCRTFDWSQIYCLFDFFTKVKPLQCPCFLAPLWMWLTTAFTVLYLNREKP